MTEAARFLEYGEHAVLIDCTPAEVAGWTATARDLFPGALDVVPGARTVVLDGVSPPSAIETLRSAKPQPTEELSATEVQVPVEYDGEDLAQVADLWSCSEAEVIRTHQECVFTVAFCGFSPGFAYLAGLPEELAVPRLATPRTRVPAGSVGFAGRWCAVYPSASPGGWQLIGRTQQVLWDESATPPALLTPGTTVRFVDG